MNEDPHARFERLAVDHVLGGLDEVPAAEFRGHLIGCHACRAQVAELRDLASHLAETERSERSLADTKVEVARREPEVEAPIPTPTWVQVAVGIAMVALIGIVLFWNLHLRTLTTAGERLADVKAGVLETLALGEPLVVELGEGVSGLVVLHGATVAIDLVGIPAVRDDHDVTLWLLPGQRREVVPASSIDAGRLALRTGVLLPVELVISVEPRAYVGSTPSGQVLVRAHLGRPENAAPESG